MKVERDKKHKRIEIPKDYIKESYEQEHYVEAIILTHYIIGVYMNRTFDTITQSLNPLASVNRVIKMQESMPSKKSKSMEKILKKLYPVSDYRFINMVNILFDMGVYDNILRKELTKFNTYRNSVAHRLFAELPDQSEFDRYYKLGMKLWDNTYEILAKYQKGFFDKIFAKFQNDKKVR